METDSNIHEDLNPNFDVTKVAMVENPLLKSSAPNRLNVFSKFKKEIDPLEKIRAREEKQIKNNPEANFDERMDQAIIREIRDGNGTIEEKRALYDRLSPEAQRSTPVSFTPDRKNDAAPPPTHREQLQKQRDKLMDKMWSTPTHETQDEITRIDKLLGRQFATGPINRAPAVETQSSFDNDQTTSRREGLMDDIDIPVEQEKNIPLPPEMDLLDDDDEPVPELPETELDEIPSLPEEPEPHIVVSSSANTETEENNKSPLRKWATRLRRTAEKIRLKSNTTSSSESSVLDGQDTVLPDSQLNKEAENYFDWSAINIPEKEDPVSLFEKHEDDIPSDNLPNLPDDDLEESAQRLNKLVEKYPPKRIEEVPQPTEVQMPPLTANESSERVQVTTPEPTHVVESPFSTRLDWTGEGQTEQTDDAPDVFPSLDWSPKPEEPEPTQEDPYVKEQESLLPSDEVNQDNLGPELENHLQLAEKLFKRREDLSNLPVPDWKAIKAIQDAQIKELKFLSAVNVHTDNLPDDKRYLKDLYNITRRMLELSHFDDDAQSKLSELQKEKAQVLSKMHPELSTEGSK